MRAAYRSISQNERTHLGCTRAPPRQSRADLRRAVRPRAPRRVVRLGAGRAPSLSIHRVDRNGTRVLGCRHQRRSRRGCDPWISGVQRAIIHTHEGFADKSFYVAGIVGVLALVALIKWRRDIIPRGIGAGMFVASAILSGMMIYTGLLGGRIRHTEVRPGATPADATTIEPPRVRPGAPANNPPAARP